MTMAELIEAVKRGDLDATAKAIKAGANVNGHGKEQEWPALCFAAGTGDLKMLKLLLDSGANPFTVGLDKRTAYKVAIAAGRVEAARVLVAAEERAGGDREKISSRSWETRPYCRAYHLRDLKQYPDWPNSLPPKNEEGSEEGNVEWCDEDVLFVQQDFTVTTSMWHGEGMVFDVVTEEWRDYCRKTLAFSVPDDFDLLPVAAEN